MPAEFFEYLKALQVEKVFITTVDRQVVRIYPIPVWKSNEGFFDNAGEMAELAEDVAYVAKYYGGDSAIDRRGACWCRRSCATCWNWNRKQCS